MKQIKCESCSGKWFVADEDLERQRACPYCLSSIHGEIEFTEYDSLDKAIYGAISQIGKDVIQNPTQLSGFMLDMAPLLKKEIRIFAKTVTDDYTTYLKNAFDTDVSMLDSTINKLRHLFISEEGLSEDWADMLCSGIHGAILYSKGIGAASIVHAEVCDFHVCKETTPSSTKTAEEAYQKPCDSASHEIAKKEQKKHTANKDIDKELENYRQIANKGYVPAFISVADIYYQQKNYRKAWKWFCKAAEAKDSTGQYYVGHFYQEGLYVKKNTYLAVKYYEKAAEQGSLPAVLAIAQCYEFGIGCGKDMKKAIENYAKAANAGYAEAQYELGLHYQTGDGVNKDIIKAAEWYQRANAQGHREAERKLNDCIAPLIQRLKWKIH